MRTIVIMVLCSVLMTYNLSAQSVAKDPEAKKILDAASKKFQTFTSLKVDFNYKMESTATGMSEEYNGSITLKGEKFLLKAGNGQETYNDGKTVWTYYVEDNEVTIFDYDPEDDQMSVDKVLNLYKSGYKYQRLEDETVDGKKYSVIDLEPELTAEERKTNQVYKIRIKFDKDNVIKSWKIFERNGNRYTMNIDKVEPNVVVSDTVFTFNKEKHQGVVVEDLR